MNKSEIRANAREQVTAALMPALMDMNAEKVEAHKKYAVPLEVGGEQVWVEVAITCKTWYDTKSAKAYNPHKEA